MTDRYRLGLVGCALTLCLACSSSHDTRVDAGSDAALAEPPREDAAVDAGGDAGVDAGRPDAGSEDAGVPHPPPGPVVCGGVECAADEACCFLTLECFDPDDTSACAVPPDEADPDACVSNADCELGEICEAFDLFEEDGEPAAACGGLVGHCVEARPEEGCGGSGAGVCGCDGRTYPDPCAASRAGVRVSWRAPCGEAPEGSSIIACGRDAQCPDGFSCCGVVGTCMPTTCPECCFAPPPGTNYPCRSNVDCGPLQEVLGIPYYCDSDGCDAAGGCRPRERRCGGEFAPVCGCDGTTYSNACWARLEGSQVAHDGECP